MIDQNKDGHNGQDLRETLGKQATNDTIYMIFDSNFTYQYNFYMTNNIIAHDKP